MDVTYLQGLWDGHVHIAGDDMVRTIIGSGLQEGFKLR